MKRKLLLLVLSVGLIASLVLVGCAPEAAAPAEEEEEAPVAEEEEEEAPAAPANEVYEGVWQDIDAAGSTQNRVLVEAMANLKATSGGRIDITVYPEGEIVPRNEGTPAVKDGVVDIATVAASMDKGRLGPATYIMTSSGLPAGPSTTDCLAWIYKGGGLETLNSAYSDFCYVKGAVAGAAELFTHSNKPLETAADFKGLKFRALGLWGEVLNKHYGASVAQLPGGELYSSMERGVIDAFEYGPASLNFVMGFQEIADYIGLPGVQSPGYTKPILVNKGFFDNLPADLQAMFVEECTALAMRSLVEVAYENSVGIQQFRDYGTKVFYVDEDFQADIAKNTRAMCEDFAAEDALFAEVWEEQDAFFKVWKGLAEITPKYTIFE